MADILFITIGGLCLLLGFTGCLLPVLPGPPLAYAGLLFLHLTDKVQFSMSQLTGWGVAVLGVQLLDYVTPLLGTKYSGGSKWGIWGCMAGTVIGIFVFPPWGILFGPFVGAVLGEIFAGKTSISAIKSGTGVFMGFLLSVVLKFALCGYFVICFFHAIFGS